MPLNVRVRLQTGEAVTIKVDLPDDIKEYDADRISDAVSDWLDDKGVERRWYSILTEDDNLHKTKK